MRKRIERYLEGLEQRSLERKIAALDSPKVHRRLERCFNEAPQKVPSGFSIAIRMVLGICLIVSGVGLLLVDLFLFGDSRSFSDRRGVGIFGVLGLGVFGIGGLFFTVAKRDYAAKKQVEHDPEDQRDPLKKHHKKS